MQRYDHGGDIYTYDQAVLDFSANANPLGYPPGLKESLLENLNSFQRYPDSSYRELRQALADRHGIKPEQVVCGNGATDLIYRICAYFRPQRALVTAPTFSEYERAVVLYGGRVSEHLLGEADSFDLDESVLEAVTEDTTLVFLCSPNNPTGRLIPLDLLREMTRRCRQIGAYVVLDECFLDFTGGESLIGFLAEEPNLLILRAFTKMYAMAGLRLGYLLASDPDLLKTIAAFGPTWSVSGPAQVAGLAALRASDWPAKTRAFFDEERPFMYRELQALGLKVFEGRANYLLFKSDRPLFAPLLEKGILVRNCGNYTGLSDLFIRIGIQTRENNLKLLAALQEVLDG